MVLNKTASIARPSGQQKISALPSSIDPPTFLLHFSSLLLSVKSPSDLAL